MPGTHLDNFGRKVVMVGKMAPPLLTFARSCAAHGVGAYLLGIEDAPDQWERYSSSLAGGAVLPKEQVGTAGGIATLKQYIDAVGADAVIAVSDSHLAWLAEHRPFLGPRCKVLGPSKETLELLQSKKAQVDLASRVGFDVLPTWYLTRESDGRAVPIDAYPVVLRPTVPAAVEPTFKVKVIRSPGDLEAFVKGVRVGEHPLVVQPFRDLPNLLVHGVRSDSCRMLALRPFLVYRKFEGVSLSIKPTPFPPGVEQACRDFADASDIHGCFHFELLLSPAEEKAYYLEVNTRLGGTTDKVARLGFDEAMLTLQAFGLFAPGGGEAPCRGGRVVNKRAILKHILWAARGRLSELDYPPVGSAGHLWRSCLELVTARDSVFDWRDVRGSVWFYLRRS
jgi:hypothetical protein